MISTLPDEVEIRDFTHSLTVEPPLSLQIALIWPGRLTVVKAIFLVNRYSVLIDTTFAVICRCLFPPSTLAVAD